MPAPRIEPVLAAFDEFSSGTVIVGHNVRFDLGFLGAARRACGWAPMTHRWVDTCALARRLVRDEVPNCRLSTLASRFRLSHQPSHRALDDALATADLLHFLLERAAAFGVLGLDDLLALPASTRIRRRPSSASPTACRGSPACTCSATQAAVPSTSARPRTCASACARTSRATTGARSASCCGRRSSIDHVPCTGPLEAAVLELRLIHRLQPRFNRQGKQWRQVRLREAHDQRAVPAALGRAHRARRRRPLHRSAALGCGGPSCHRGDRDRDPAATLQRGAGSLRPAGAVRVRTARRLDVPVLGGDLRGRLPRHRRSHRERHHDRSRACCSIRCAGR